MTADPATAQPGPDVARCSSKGCRADAEWALRWNNPRIHTPDRRKVWTACDEHREHLSGFLSARGFLRDVVPGSEVSQVTEVSQVAEVSQVTGVTEGEDGPG